MKTKELKEKMLNSLEGKFEVTKVKKIIGDDIDIQGNFIFKGRNGIFSYCLEGNEKGINWVEDFEEQDDEDIYEEINNWIDEHLEHSIIIKVDGKEI